jgi:hypothetical protein
MECPPGKKYSAALKKCVHAGALPASVGKSQVPCLSGKVWLAQGRRCVNKNIYEKIYGAAAVRAASEKQKALAKNLTRKVKKPASVAGIAGKANVTGLGASSAARQSVAEITTAAARSGATIGPGLSRDAMVAWVSKHCKNTDDPVTMDPYSEASVDDLRSLVRLNSGFCYTADTLDQHVQASIERGIPVRDMLNPGYRLNAADYGALQKAARITRKSYKLPGIPVTLPAEHYKLFIGVLDDPAYKYVFLFDERKVVSVAGGVKNYSPAIPEGGWIGYIPVAGTADLEKLIKKAFLAGRIFTKATKPFGCCRFHLKKDKEFWKTDAARKIKAMEDEIRELI